MALTLENILKVADIEEACKVSTGDVATSFRDRAITRAAKYMGLALSGAMVDANGGVTANNPFISQAHTETVDGTGGKLLRLAHFPITAVTTVKLNGTDQSYTVKAVHEDGIDAWILDSIAHGKYSGDLKKNSGIWVKGRMNWEFAYTAGYESTTFPEGLTEGILIIAIWLFGRAGDIGILSKKIFQKAVQYQASLVPKNNTVIPMEAAIILERYMPV